MRAIFLVLTLVHLAWTCPARAFDGAFVLIEGGAWDVEQGPVEYVLEPSGVDDVSDGSDLRALRDAFRAWECVDGTSLRFVEGEGAGPATLDLSDGKNTLFWDESGEFDLGPGVLGVTLGDAGGTVREAADIIFNGADSAWSTDDGPSGVDVGAIAIHEIGHFIGLDHPCDFAGGGESNCNGPERSVMTPVWGGELDRTPKRDDEEGVVALYSAAGDGSTCHGPFRRGEKCTCGSDCVDGLACASVGGGPAVCAETCQSDASDCVGGFACVLDRPIGDEPAAGICLKTDLGGKPAGAVCTGATECASGTCLLLFDVQRSLCQEPCSSTSDCSAGACFDGFCLGVVDLHECDDDDETPDCACSSATARAPAVPGVLAALALAGWCWCGRRVMSGGRRRMSS
jgi:hypothetical protein